MISFFFRFRWAIVLATLQGVFFVSMAVSEHRRNLRENHKEVVTHIEYFGCFQLPHQRIPSDEWWPDDPSFECWLAPRLKFLLFSNLPVFMVWNGIAALIRNTNLDQLRLFYLVNGLGIPAFWFFIGSLIDRRRHRKSAALLYAPKEQTNS